jgi:hypothetical protein
VVSFTIGSRGKLPGKTCEKRRRRNNNNNNNNNDYNDDVPLLCCIVKYYFYIPQVLMVWQHTANETGAFATVINVNLKMS